MVFKYSTLATTISLALGSSIGAHAALTTSAVLNFIPGTGPAEGGSPPATGSWFSLLVADNDGDYYVDSNVYYPLSPFNGIHIGTVQTASGSHNGKPGCDPSKSICSGAGGPGEDPNIDNPWVLLGATGMHLTTSPITEVGSTASGFVKTLDFSGWAFTWNGIPAIALGGDPANYPSDTGTASITCSVASCSASSTFTLDYQGHVPVDDPSNFGRLFYALHLEGHISTVPAPAAAWLFASGLAGLGSVVRRRKRWSNEYARWRTPA
jgi:hypothetical protein